MVSMEAGNLEPKTDHSIHFLHAREKKNKNKRSAGVLNGVPCARFESKGSAKVKCFSVSETLEPKPEYDKRVQRKQS